MGLIDSVLGREEFVKIRATGALNKVEPGEGVTKMHACGFSLLRE